MKIRLGQLFDKARSANIELTRSEDGPIKFGGPSTDKQRAVADEFNQLTEKCTRTLGMSRREFFKSPIATAVAGVAISSGLGLSILPKTAKAATGDFLQPYPFLQFANPVLPMSQADWDAAPKVNEDFSTKTAIIIGGSRGIGEAMARQFKDDLGFGRVIATCRDAKRYPNYRSDIELLSSDCTRADQRTALANYIKTHVGQIDLIVLNAVRFFVGRPTESSGKAEDIAMQTGCWGLVESWKTLEPFMPKTGYARVLINNSPSHRFSPLPSSFTGFPGIGGTEFYAYTAAKRALFAYSMALHAEATNASNPAVGYPPGTRTNLSVAINIPFIVDVVSQGNLSLEKDMSFGETDVFGKTNDYSLIVLDGFNKALLNGMHRDVAARAYRQLAELENPGLVNYCVDLEHVVDIFNDPIAIQQFAVAFFIAYEDEISVRSLALPTI